MKLINVKPISKDDAFYDIYVELQEGEKTLSGVFSLEVDGRDLEVDGDVTPQHFHLLSEEDQIKIYQACNALDDISD